MDLTDAEIAILDTILTDEWDRNFDEPGRVSEEDRMISDELRWKVRQLAKSRNLWWAR